MEKAETVKCRAGNDLTQPEFKKRKTLHLCKLIAPITYLLGFIAAIVIYCVAKLLLSLSLEHEWFSSYIEIVFGLNAGLSLFMIRKWCLPVKRDLIRHKQKIKAMADDGTDKKMAVYINSRVLRYINRIDYYLAKDTKVIIILARCFCVFSLVLMVSGSPRWFLPFATLLILPLVMYYIAYKYARIIFFEECVYLYAKVRFCLFPVLKHGGKMKLHGLNEYAGSVKA